MSEVQGEEHFATYEDYQKLGGLPELEELQKLLQQELNSPYLELRWLSFEQLDAVSDGIHSHFILLLEGGEGSTDYYGRKIYTDRYTIMKHEWLDEDVTQEALLKQAEELYAEALTRAKRMNSLRALQADFFQTDSK